MMRSCGSTSESCGVWTAVKNLVPEHDGERTEMAASLELPIAL